MTLHEVGPESTLCVQRSGVAVCVPVYGAPDKLAECLRALTRHTDAAVPILVADDASPDPEIRRLVERVADAHPTRTLAYLRQPSQLGFVGNCNTAFELLAPADVVLLNSDCVVTAGWLDALGRAARSNSRVATVSALSNSATILSIPERNQPVANLPQDWTLDAAAAAIRDTSPQLHPRIPTAVGHCVYVRRTALDLAGSFDLAFAPGYEEEVDFSQRCLSHGLCHVVADDVFVLHYGGASFGTDDRAAVLRRRHHEIICQRYPYYPSWIREVQRDEVGALSRSLRAARRALQGLTVTIDGRILTRFLTGTQLHVLELVTALDAQEGLQLRVIVPPDLGDYAAAQLGALPSVTLQLADTSVDIRADVVHRPYQVSSAEDLVQLRRWGHKVVVTHQDLIGFDNPRYFARYDEWYRFRRVTREALALADRVVFFSRHAAQEAIAADLIDPLRGEVVYIGTDHRLTETWPEPERPRASVQLGNQPFLLCLGTDFLHKNRLFAIKLLHELREQHDWDGKLVLAGPRVAMGSSAGEEAAYLGAHPDLEEHVLDVAAVNEAEKAWLLQNARAVVYPTTVEGFGLLPFEAAAEGLPCLFAHETALQELFPPEAAVLVPWDVRESARKVLPLLEDGDDRRAHVMLLRAAAAQLTWEKTARGLADVYRAVADEPTREAAHAVAAQVEIEAELDRARDERDAALTQLRKLQPRSQELARIERDPARRALAGTSGVFSDEIRRILLAVGYRRWLRRLVFGTMTGIYRLVYFVRHGRRPHLADPQEGNVDERS